MARRPDLVAPPPVPCDEVVTFLENGQGSRHFPSAQKGLPQKAACFGHARVIGDGPKTFHRLLDVRDSVIQSPSLHTGPPLMVEAVPHHLLVSSVLAGANELLGLLEAMGQIPSEVKQRCTQAGRRSPSPQVARVPVRGRRSMIILQSAVPYTQTDVLVKRKTEVSQAERHGMLDPFRQSHGATVVLCAEPRERNLVAHDPNNGGASNDPYREAASFG